MAVTQLATKINASVKKAIEKACKTKGVKMGRFSEYALLDKLEELEDIEEVKHLRKEPSRSLADVTKALKIGHRKDAYR